MYAQPRGGRPRCQRATTRAVRPEVTSPTEALDELQAVGGRARQRTARRHIRVVSCRSCVSREIEGDLDESCQETDDTTYVMVERAAPGRAREALAVDTMQAVTEVRGPAGTYTAWVEGPTEGEVVLLLHGFPQTRHTWRQQVPSLAAAGYRVVAPDQRGYSPGARPDPSELSNYGIDVLVADALALAAAGANSGGSALPDGDQPSPFHLVGHDWGGAVAWMVAAQHPERLRSLTVLSRPHPHAFRRALRLDAGGQQHRSRHHRAFLDPQTVSLLLADGARRLRRTLHDQGVPSASVDEYLSVLDNPAALEAAVAWYRAAAGNLGRMEAGLVSVPTLYVWGDADATVGAEAARWTADYVTGTYRFEVLPGVGHFATDEAPEQVASLLLDHLRGCGGPGRGATSP